MHSGTDRGTSYPLATHRITLGRGRDADIVLTDPMVSSRHLALEPVTGGVIAEDLDSANGTVAAGERMKPGERQLLPFATMLEIGDSIIEVVAPGAEPRSAAPTITRSGRSGFFGTGRGKLVIALIAASAVASLIVGVVALTRGGSTTTVTGAPAGAGEASSAKRSTVLVSVADGSGTGIVVDAEAGLVATNYHVVAGSRTADVLAPGLADWSASASVVATSPCDDVALLQVDGGGGAWSAVESIEFAPGAPEAGARAFALGYPATAGNATGVDTNVSLTGGIVSNPSTRYDDPTSGVMPLPSVIQHDAAINPGNSGGPLVDDQGRLLGMNTALYALGDMRLEGQSYAITADHLRTTLDRLSRGESLGDFGLLLEPYTDTVFDGDREDEPNGLIVYALDPDGPADRAGIERDGLIAYVGEDRVRDLSDWCSATQDASVIDVGYANAEETRIRDATLRAY